MVLSSADFFQNKLFQNFLTGTPSDSECQTAWIQIRNDRTSVLIWVQTVFKGYHQGIKIATRNERVTFSCCMTILRKVHVPQLRLRSNWASVKSNQSLLLT